MLRVIRIRSDSRRIQISSTISAPRAEEYSCWFLCRVDSSEIYGECMGRHGGRFRGVPRYRWIRDFKQRLRVCGCVWFRSRRMKFDSVIDARWSFRSNDASWHCLPPFVQAHPPAERNYAMDSEKRVIDLAAIFSPLSLLFFFFSP